MERYEKYKDSGVEWIGEIPVHWSTKKLKYVVEVNPSKSIIDFDKNSSNTVVFLPMEKVSENGKIDQSLRKKIAELSSGFTYFEKNDVIIAKITPCFENGKGALLVDLDTEFGFGSTEFHTIRATEKLTKEFVYYITRSEKFMTLGEAFMTGSAGQKRVPTNFIKEFKIGLPPDNEQADITNYLDKKTSELDTLITKKEKLIELLKEERTAIINQAVTKGLDPDVEMKDSGVEWLGEIPAHWEVRKIGYVSKVVRGASPRPAGDPKYFNGSFLPWITVKEVTNATGMYITGTEEYLTEEGSKNTRIIEPETLLLSNSGATLGVPRISKIRGGINDGSVAFFNPTAERDFLYWFFITHTKIYREEASGYGQPNLNTEIVKQTPIAIPPLTEQLDIIQHIYVEQKRVETIISKTNQEITLLKEYKTALISEVVTGKVKVF